MEALISFINYLLPFLYLVVVYVYAHHFFVRRGHFEPFLSHGLFALLGIHFLEILLRMLHMERFPLANSAEAATALAFALSLMYAFLEWRIGVKTTGWFVLIIALMLQIYSSFFITIEANVPDFFSNPFFVFHTSSVMLGYAALFISGLYGMMFLMLFYQMKSGGFGLFYQKLPPLDTLGEMCGKTITPGFILLTLGITMGIYWRMQSFPEDSHFDPKVVFAYGIWVYYLILALGWLAKKVTGKRLAYGSLAGFVLILINYVLIRVVVDSFHNFG